MPACQTNQSKLPALHHPNRVHFYFGRVIRDLIGSTDVCTEFAGVPGVQIKVLEKVIPPVMWNNMNDLVPLLDLT